MHLLLELVQVRQGQLRLHRVQQALHGAPHTLGALPLPA